jgi:RinA family phage transcriptional activator
MRIDKSIFRYIEHELYNYDETKRELERYREEILEGTPFQEVSVQTNPGNPTAQKAIKLTSSAFVVQAEKVISAIDRSLAILGDKYMELFEHKYQKGLPWQEVALEMDISDRTYFRLRRELVMTVGQQLGLLNIE